MVQNPEVSMVIPFYNCPNVDQAIESALNQSYPNIQVIVVDNGSTKCSEKITPFLSRIRYIKKGNGNRTKYRGSKCNREYFTWLSSDDLFDKHKIEKQVAFMRERAANVRAMVIMF